MLIMNSLPANMKVLYYFQNLSEKIQSELSKGAEGFTPTEIDLIINLGQPLKMKELAKAIFCQPSNVTSIVDKMENDGFIKRERSTKDRRVIEIALTEKGLEARKILIEKIENVIREKSGLTDTSYNKILNLITKGLDNEI